MGKKNAHQTYLRKMAIETARERMRRAQQNVRDARAARRGAKAHAQQACLDARRTLKEWRTTEKARVKAEIARLRSELAEGIAQRKARVAQCCGPDKARAREEGNQLVAGTRAELAELLEAQRLERVWKGKGKAGKAPAGATRRDARAESDDHEVEVNLTPEQRIVWERVKGKIKPGARRSRTEAFLEWMHDHSADVARIHADEAERQVREAVKHEAEQRRALEGMPRASMTKLREYLSTGLEALGVAGVPVVSPMAGVAGVIERRTKRPPAAAAFEPLEPLDELDAPSSVRPTLPPRAPSVPLPRQVEIGRPFNYDPATDAALDRVGVGDHVVATRSLSSEDGSSPAGSLLRVTRIVNGPNPHNPSSHVNLEDEHGRRFERIDTHWLQLPEPQTAPPAPAGRINIGAPYAYRLPLDHVGVGDQVVSQRGLMGPDGGISSNFPMVVARIVDSNRVSLVDQEGRRFEAKPDWLTLPSSNTPRPHSPPSWLKSAEQARLDPAHDDTDGSVNAWAYFESVHEPGPRIAATLLMLPHSVFEKLLNVHGAEAVAAARAHVATRLTDELVAPAHWHGDGRGAHVPPPPPAARFVGRAHERTAKRGKRGKPGKTARGTPTRVVVPEFLGAFSDLEARATDLVSSTPTRIPDRDFPDRERAVITTFAGPKGSEVRWGIYPEFVAGGITRPLAVDDSGNVWLQNGNGDTRGAILAPLEGLTYGELARKALAAPAGHMAPAPYAGGSQHTPSQPDYDTDDYAAFARRVMRIAQQSPRKPLGDGSPDDSRALLRGVFDAGAPWWLSDPHAGRGRPSRPQWELWQDHLRACINLGLLRVARWDLLGRDEYVDIREANTVKLPGKGEAHLLVLDAAPVPF